MSRQNTDFGREAIVIGFLCGAVGGAAPSLLDLASRARIEQLPSGGYYIAMAIFAFLGGFLALIYKEKITHKAFFLGVGAPALIVAGGKAVDSGSAWILDPGLTKTAYAQENTTLAPSRPSAVIRADQDGSVRLVYVGLDRSILREAPVDVSLRFEVTGPDGKREVPVSTVHRQPVLTAGTTAPWTIGTANLPGDTVAMALNGFVVQSGQGIDRTLTVRTDPVPLPPGRSPLLVNLYQQVSFWAGFFDGIGMKNLARRQTEYFLSVQTVEPAE